MALYHGSCIRQPEPSRHLMLCRACLSLREPSFAFVALSSAILPRLRRSAWTGSFLDGVKAAALGMTTIVTWQLGRASFANPLSLLVSLAVLALHLRFTLNSMWLFLAGALIGLLRPVVK